MLKRNSILFSLFLAYGIVLVHNLVPHHHGEIEHNQMEEHHAYVHEDHHEVDHNHDHHQEHHTEEHSNESKHDDHDQNTDFGHALAHFVHSDIAVSSEQISVQSDESQHGDDYLIVNTASAFFTEHVIPPKLLRKQYFPVWNSHYSGYCISSRSLRAPPVFA